MISEAAEARAIAEQESKKLEQASTMEEMSKTENYHAVTSVLQSVQEKMVEEAGDTRPVGGEWYVLG